MTIGMFLNNKGVVRQLPVMMAGNNWFIISPNFATSTSFGYVRVEEWVMPIKTSQNMSAGLECQKRMTYQ